MSRTLDAATQAPSSPLPAQATAILGAPIRLLVCGNRDWTCIDTIAAWLRPFRKRGPVTVIHGAQKTFDPESQAYIGGADFLAGEVARAMGYAVEEYPADWNADGRSAGPTRNRRMFAQGKPTRGLAFGRILRSDGRRTGTGDMVDVMNEGGVIVTVVPRAGVLP